VTPRVAPACCAEPTTWSRFCQWVQFQIAICSNYNSIIKITDELSNDPNSSADEVAWANYKKDEAIEGKKQHGCSSRRILKKKPVNRSR
jgi:hypothetical protein